VKEITVANDGIVNQKAVMAYATGSFPMIQYLDKLGVKFEKDGTGEYNMRKVHHVGTYVLPMREGHQHRAVGVPLAQRPVSTPSAVGTAS